jgi:hypothetical protein
MSTADGAARAARQVDLMTRDRVSASAAGGDRRGDARERAGTGSRSRGGAETPQEVDSMVSQPSTRIGSIVVGLLVAWNTLGAASPATAEPVRTDFQYAVKVTCSLLGTFGEGFLANGTYRTVVNVHNPTTKRVTVGRKVVIAGPENEPASQFSISPFRKVTVEPDGAFQLDCFAISNTFCPIDGVCVDFTAIDGFVVIASPVELDVVGVYTVARRSDSEVATHHVELVPGRRLRQTIDVVTPPAPSEIKQRIRR